METEVHTNRRKKKKKNGSALRVAIIVLLSLILVVGSVFAFLYLRDQYNANLEQSILNATEFHEGVTIGGVDVSGMSPEEAKQALVALEDEIKAGIYFNFLCDGKTFTADSSYFDIAFDTDSVLKEAMDLARSGDLESLKAELEDIKTNGRDFELTYTVTPHPGGGIHPFLCGLPHHPGGACLRGRSDPAHQSGYPGPGRPEHRPARGWQHYGYAGSVL